MDAENAIKQRLSELVHPEITEEYLDQIAFTLDICARILPDDTDPLYFSRLEVLDSYIQLALE